MLWYDMRFAHQVIRRLVVCLSSPRYTYLGVNLDARGPLLFSPPLRLVLRKQHLGPLPQIRQSPENAQKQSERQVQRKFAACSLFVWLWEWNAWQRTKAVTSAPLTGNCSA